MTSPIRRFGVPYEQSAGRSLRKDVTFKIVISGTGVAPVNKVEMKPCSMMATLINRSQAMCFSRDENAPCLCTFQNRSKPGGLRNPQTSAQLSGMGPGPHSGVGPSGVGKTQSAKASSRVLRLFLLRQRHAVPLKSPATKSTS